MRVKIFINYRKKDSGHGAGRIFDRLQKKFGSGAVFIDVNSIDLGANFADRIVENISSCNVVLVIIGQQWLAQLAGGASTDYVLLEIGAALKREIPVIPVFIDGATMPVDSQLPPDLLALGPRHGIEINHRSFERDAKQLIAGINRAFQNVRVDASDSIVKNVAFYLLNNKTIEATAWSLLIPGLGLFIHGNESQRVRASLYFFVTSIAFIIKVIQTNLMDFNHPARNFIACSAGTALIASLIVGLLDTLASIRSID